ncbi:MAG: prepilin-type N-terminal cleavage/methylation domain-containing protein [Acidobacteria bacterium]|nr:prepilin-type N-terminal cleavage/methylation domain-containing protein [Acidobacteriota bacterium]
MARLTRNGRLGFSLVELMIVMAVLGILLSVAVPQYNKALIRSKETILKQNLFTMRTTIDEYTYDKGKAPQSLEDLVTAGYLRKLPYDPMTNSDRAWKVIMEDASNAVNQSEPGIFDVRSTSDKTSLEGTPYAEW